MHATAAMVTRANRFIAQWTLHPPTEPTSFPQNPSLTLIASNQHLPIHDLQFQVYPVIPLSLQQTHLPIHDLHHQMYLHNTSLLYNRHIPAKVHELTKSARIHPKKQKLSITLRSKIHRLKLHQQPPPNTSLSSFIKEHIDNKHTNYYYPLL